MVIGCAEKIGKGEELIDLQTGESLGSEDQELGEVKVKSVKEKYSIGGMLSGGDLAAKDILIKK